MQRKIILYALILVVLVGLFGLAGKAWASTTNPNEACKDDASNKPCTPTPTTMGTCKPSLYQPTRTIQANCTGTWEASTLAEFQAVYDAAQGNPPAKTSGDQSAFAKAVEDASCTVFSINLGCTTKILYYILYLPSTFLLWLSAEFFNALVAISLTSKLLANGFVSSAWGVVRDLSNIFFILILLYIAIKIILDLGGSEAKKMIARVIIVALLINFSMFFTQVVIDSSNILALIFYNKLNVTGKDGKPIPSGDATGAGQRNISGAMYNSFDATKLLNDGFFKKATEATTPGYTASATAAQGQVAPGILIGIMLVAVAIMFFAAYCFFMSGIFFVSRLIELFILIIFSPFALMSFPVPLFSGIDYIGWDDWSKRLLKVAFMAPIFMFFLYFIFMLLKANMFQDLLGNNNTMVQLILGIVIPALVILILLLKATEYAKKGSGVIGEKLMTGAKMVGGLALGAATGGTALALRGTVGKGAANLAESNRMRDWAARSKFGAGVQRMTSGVASSSFDVRAASIGGKTLAGATGLNIGKAQAGGYTKTRAERDKRAEEFANKQLDTSDYGKAQMTRGGMSLEEANRMRANMIAGGMDAQIAARHRDSLMQSGIDTEDVSGVARYLDAGRRNTFANRIERRTGNRLIQGGGFGPAEARNARRRMAANKVRKSAATAAQQAQLARAMAALAAAQAAANPPAGTATPPAATPPPVTPPAHP